MIYQWKGPWTLFNVVLLILTRENIHIAAILLKMWWHAFERNNLWRITPPPHKKWKRLKKRKRKCSILNSKTQWRTAGHSISVSYSLLLAASEGRRREETERNRARREREREWEGLHTVLGLTMDEVITAADAAAVNRTTPLYSPPSVLSPNLPLLSALLACALAQFLKIFTTWSVRSPHFLSHFSQFHPLPKSIWMLFETLLFLSDIIFIPLLLCDVLVESSISFRLLQI